MRGSGPMSTNATNAYFLRLLAYFVVGAVLCESIVRVAEAGYVASLARDGGLLETLQFLLVLTAGTSLLLMARREASFSVVLKILGALALFAAGRELDSIFDSFLYDYVGTKGYWLVTVPAGSYAGYLIWRHRHTVVRDVQDFSRTRGFPFFVVGFFVISLFAQLLGQKGLWQAAMGDDFHRLVKDIVEESIELFGYLLVFVGTIETFFHTRPRSHEEP